MISLLHATVVLNPIFYFLWAKFSLCFLLFFALNITEHDEAPSNLGSCCLCHCLWLPRGMGRLEEGMLELLYDEWRACTYMYVCSHLKYLCHWPTVAIVDTLATWYYFGGGLTLVSWVNTPTGLDWTADHELHYGASQNYCSRWVTCQLRLRYCRPVHVDHWPLQLGSGVYGYQGCWHAASDYFYKLVAVGKQYVGKKAWNYCKQARPSATLSSLHALRP
jgi:hypothetical protein